MGGAVCRLRGLKYAFGLPRSTRDNCRRTLKVDGPDQSNPFVVAYGSGENSIETDQFRGVTPFRPGFHLQFARNPSVRLSVARRLGLLCGMVIGMHLSHNAIGD